MITAIKHFAAALATSACALAVTPGLASESPTPSTNPVTVKSQNQEKNETFFPFMTTGIGSCTKNSHDITIEFKLAVSLEDVVRPGKGPADGTALKNAVAEAQGTGNRKNLNREYNRYDFKKVDQRLLHFIGNTELDRVAQRYDAAEFEAFGPDIAKDVEGLFKTIARDFEVSTGVSIIIQMTNGVVSTAPSSRCLEEKMKRDARNNTEDDKKKLKTLSLS